jgi:hypothetical protein
MKTLKLLAIGMVLFFASTVHAQVSVNVNLGTAPQWGPAGYSDDVRYYYLPDVQAYYDVNASMFIYQSGGVWIHRTYLPSRYRDYDLYGGYKVVMTDYHGNRPYAHYREYRTKYARGYRGHEQRNIGQRPERGHSPANYSNERNRGNQGNRRGNGKGEGRGYDNGHDNGRGNGHGNGYGNGHDKGNGHNKGNGNGNDNEHRRNR